MDWWKDGETIGEGKGCPDDLVEVKKPIVRWFNVYRDGISRDYRTKDAATIKHVRVG
jgi:hypothetical protein